MAATMRFLRLLSLIALVFAIGLLANAGSALAIDQATIEKADRTAQSAASELSDIDHSLQLPTLSDTQLTDYRSRIEDLRASALTMSAALAQPLADVTAQVKLLPPPPAADQPPETPAIAEQRAKLNGQLGQIQGIKTQLDLVAANADLLAARASGQQRNLFLTRIFEGGKSILNPALWADTVVGLGLLLSRLGLLFQGWWNVVNGSAKFGMLGLVPAILAAMTGLVLILRRRLQAWTSAVNIGNRAPSDFERIWRVARATLVMLILVLLTFLPVYAALEVGGFTTPRFDMVFWGLADLVSTTAVYWVLAYRLASPGMANWRIINLDDTAARRLPALVGVLVFLSAFTSATGTIADGLYLPVTYTIGQSALSALIMLVLLALILVTLRDQAGIGARLPGRSLYFTWASALAPLLWLLVIVGLAALLFGYVALASYLAQQIINTVFIGVVLLLIHHLGDLAVAASFDPQTFLGRLIRRITGFGERTIERLGLIARVVVDALLLLIGLPLMFLQWTVTWVDFRSLATSAFLGFKIGNVTVSPWLIAMMALTLAGGVIVTNLLVRWLDGRILGQSRLDKGVQDSLRKGVSYAGYTLAVGVALSAAGLDFSTLTIVFGALGVGIGFGLQSIVNNFVSGLILLAERPIRIGDWVVLDGGEGLVKRINVRTTEIETFDNCSVIVPNASLVNGIVKNWTHGDTMGRFTVPITAAYGSDPALVQQILLDCAKAHPKVLSYPEPMVLLQRFSPAGLDFEIKGAVGDIFLGGIVASDLRFAVLKAFGEKSVALGLPATLLQTPPSKRARKS